MGAECSTETSASPTGVRVIRVDSDGCAAGRLRVGDRIVRINGVPVRDHRDASAALQVLQNSTGSINVELAKIDYWIDTPINYWIDTVTIHKASASVRIGVELQGYNPPGRERRKLEILRDIYLASNRRGDFSES
jgi:PDZ domain-containing secreted protein